MGLNTFGWTPAEVTTDSAGNVISGVTLTVFTDVTKASQVTTLYDKDGVTAIPSGVVVSDNKGRFGFKASDAYSMLYVYDGSTADPWPIAAHEALDQGMASHAQAVADAQAAANSAAASAALVGAPADSAIAAAINGTGTQTKGALNGTLTGAGLSKRAKSTDPTLAKADNAAAPLTIATPDGSGIIVHPSVYYNPTGWNGHRFWMAATPYNNADSSLENPCIYYSDDGDTWTAPAGLTNPIEAYPGSSNYNSDPDLVEGPDGRLYCIFRQNRFDLAGQEEQLLYRASSDGVNWSDRQAVLINNSAVRKLVSPAFVYDRGQWVMYAVDILPATKVMVRLTAPALTGPWSAPQTVTLTGQTMTPWHIEVRKFGDEWHALLNDGGGSGGDLYAATSRDGLTFKVGAPFIARGGGGNAWDLKFYRSAFVPAVKDGVEGWELWYGSFGTTTSKIGHSFVSFGKLNEHASGLVPAHGASDLSLVDALAARLGFPPFVAGDSFVRADAASLTTAESGQTWEASASTFAIVSKTARPSSAANTRAFLDSGTADHWAQVKITNPNTANQQWLCARAQDGSNYYRLGFQGSFTLNLQKIVGGAVTAISSFSAVAAGDTIGLRCKGSTLTVYVNGVAKGSVTDTTLTTGTKAGVQANATAAEFRYFTLRTA